MCVAFTIIPRSLQQAYFKKQSAQKDANAKVECDILSNIERRFIRLLKE